MWRLCCCPVILILVQIRWSGGSRRIDVEVGQFVFELRRIFALDMPSGTARSSLLDTSCRARPSSAAGSRAS